VNHDSQFAYLQIEKKQICLKTAYDNLLFTDKEASLFFLAGEIN
jgi:hypothetical protein